MKSSIIYYSILLLIIISATSCRKERGIIKGEGSNVTNSRSLSSFRGVSLEFDASVEIYYDSVYRVELVGQQNILNVIRTEVRGSNLEIKLNNFTTIRKHNPITIRVYTPKIENLEVNGSGNISCIGSFDADQLSTYVNGSGNLNFKGVIRNSFTASVNGSGNISYNGNGTCNQAKYTISGSGDINAEWLKADNVESRVSGSGDQRIYAVKNLNVDISGSGDVYYRGNPAVTVNISGSGRLISIQ